MDRIMAKEKKAAAVNPATAAAPGKAKATGAVTARMKNKFQSEVASKAK